MRPPSISNMFPLTYAPARLAKNRTAPAKSLISPALPSGMKSLGKTPSVLVLNTPAVISLGNTASSQRRVSSISTSIIESGRELMLVS
jgi:hypothetical protein